MTELVKTLEAARGPGASDRRVEGYLLSPDPDGRLAAWLSTSTGIAFRPVAPLLEPDLQDAVNGDHAAHVAEFTIAALASQATERTVRTTSNLLLSEGARARIKLDAGLVRNWPVTAACLLLAVVVCAGQFRLNALNTTLIALRDNISRAHATGASASRPAAAMDMEYARQPVPTSAILALIIATIPESIELEELTITLPPPTPHGAASNTLTITAKGSELSPLAISELSERVQGVAEFQDVYCRQLGDRSSRTGQREFTLALTMPLDRPVSGTEVAP